MALTPEQVAEYRNKYKIGGAITQPASSGYTGADLKQDYLQMGSDISSSWQKAGQGVVDIATSDKTLAQKIVGGGADVFRGIAGTIGSVFTGAGKMAIPQSAEESIKKGVQEVGATIAGTSVAQDIYASYQRLDPGTKEQVDNALGYLEGATSIVAPGQAKKIVEQVVRNAAEKASKVVSGATDAAFQAATSATSAVARRAGEVAPGTVQMVKELAERLPRAGTNIRESLQESAMRAEKIKASSPAVQNAIKSGVDDPLINTVVQADDATRKAYKEMIDIAETPKQTIRPAQQPSIVAGRAAEKMYDVLEAERKRIGTELGNEIKALPTGTKVNMGVSMSQMASVLSDNGVTITRDGLQFAGKYTKAQRARIQELWDVVHELPAEMTPKQVQTMDQLLSQLQREARMEQLQDIIVDVNGENKNLFQLFREQYTNQLENLNPRIRELNKQYRDSRILLDDLENSIFKSGKFETTGSVDGAEFAKTNLRRIMGEAQSSPAYAEILSKMDARARELGYDGANPADLIYFAEEMRKLYPETIPKTGFQGGIRTGVVDLAERALNMGAPSTKDKQKALRAMLQELDDAAQAREGITPGVSATAPVETPTQPLSASKKQVSQEVGRSKTSSSVTLPQQSSASTPLSTATPAPAQKTSSQRVKSVDDFVKTQKAAAIERDKSLVGVDAQIQEASIKKYEQNRGKLLNEIIEQNGKVVNTDEARKMYKDVGYNGTNAAAVHEASSALAKDHWRYLLNNGKGITSLIYAGGSGTGKSSVVKQLIPDDLGSARAVLDGNLSSLKSATARIKESKEAGVKPVIVYVYRDIADAWENGVIKRMRENPNEGGRIVRMSVMLDNHKGSYDVVRRLVDANDGNIQIKLIDNSRGRGKAKLMSVDDLNRIVYNIDETRSKLLARTKELLDNGTITPEQYKELIK